MMTPSSHLTARPPYRLTAGVALTLAACAHIEPPPGGPPDAEPPFVTAVTPDSGAIVPGFDGDAIIRFNEVIEERAGGGRGARTGIGAMVLLSPVRGEVKVSWKRDAIAVRPDRGWEPGRIYHLEVLPGVRDLRGNVMEEGRRIIFSTGPDIVATTLAGVAVDWQRGAMLAGALIDARPAGDSVGYRTTADSTGRFSLESVPPGAYVVYAVQDQNRNMRLDGREAHDSALVTLDSTARVELWTLQRDTIPPRVRNVRQADSLAAHVELSQPVDPYQPVDSLLVRVRALPDSNDVSVVALWRPAAYDSILTAARAAARDTAADTTAADTAARARDTVPPPARDTAAAAGVRDTLGAARGRAPAPRDSLTEAILSQRPPLSDRLVIGVAAPWQPGGRYLIEIFGLRSAAGVVADTVAGVLAIPEAREVAPGLPDTTRRGSPGRP